MGRRQNTACVPPLFQLEVVPPTQEIPNAYSCRHRPPDLLKRRLHLLRPPQGCLWLPSSWRYLPHGRGIRRGLPLPLLPAGGRDPARIGESGSKCHPIRGTGHLHSGAGGKHHEGGSHQYHCPSRRDHTRGDSVLRMGNPRVPAWTQIRIYKISWRGLTPPPLPHIEESQRSNQA